MVHLIRRTPARKFRSAAVISATVIAIGAAFCAAIRDAHKSYAVIKANRPADTPVVIYEVEDRTDLQPGAPVSFVAIKQPDGTYEVVRGVSAAMTPRRPSDRNTAVQRALI